MGISFEVSHTVRLKVLEANLSHSPWSGCRARDRERRPDSCSRETPASCKDGGAWASDHRVESEMLWWAIWEVGRRKCFYFYINVLMHTAVITPPSDSLSHFREKLLKQLSSTNGDKNGLSQLVSNLEVPFLTLTYTKLWNHLLLSSNRIRLSWYPQAQLSQTSRQLQEQQQRADRLEAEAQAAKVAAQR